MPLSIAILGCGGRGRGYATIMGRDSARFRLVACADPVAGRRAAVARAAGGAIEEYDSDVALFARGRIADVLVISTQDSDHHRHAMRALELGYDLLLEKPVAPTPGECLDISARAQALGRRVVVCHVLRYTRFYRTVRALIDRGDIGQPVAIEATEGVDPWHQAHSYVRGPWSDTARSTPMIVAKCCHDIDLIGWFAGRPAERVASFGSLEFFRPERAPVGAPARCTDGCPHAATCAYDAHHYLGRHRGWLDIIRHVENADDDALEWLRASPWSRCVWKCGNDAVDRQVVALGFAGGITASLTMTAFASGRSLAISGSEGRLVGGEALRGELGCDLVVQRHHGGTRQRIDVGAAIGGHAGGDEGVIDHLHQALTTADPAQVQADFAASVDHTVLSFAAEEARVTGQVVAMAAYRARHAPGRVAVA